MSFTLYKQAAFASGLTGDVGYALFDADGTPNGTRITAGIVELGTSGVYGATVTFPDSFDGSLLWDDGQGSPTYFSEAINSQLSPYSAPAGTAYASVDDLRAELKLSATETVDDTLLGEKLAEAQAIFERETERKFAAQNSPTTRYFDAIRDAGPYTPYSRISGLTLYLDEDLSRITSIVNGDGTTLSASDYVTEPRNDTPFYAIRLKGSKGIAWTYTDDPQNAIAITGDWCYSLTAPADVKRAVIALAAKMYRSAGNNPDVDRPVLAGSIVLKPADFPSEFWTAVKVYRKKVI